MLGLDVNLGLEVSMQVGENHELSYHRLERGIARPSGNAVILSDEGSTTTTPHESFTLAKKHMDRFFAYSKNTFPQSVVVETFEEQVRQVELAQENKSLKTHILEHQAKLEEAT